MPDIALHWEPTTALGDWSLAGDDLAAGNDLYTAILVSLFSNRGSWWADAYTKDPLGSDLYTLERAKKTNTKDLELRAARMCKAALQWLIDDGVAASVDVLTEWQQRGLLAIAITVTEPS